MLRRSIETAQYIDEEEYDVKQMRMLNELNAVSTSVIPLFTSSEFD